MNSNSKLYNVALEILQDSSEQIHILHWPIIQLHHLELCCKCYWGLKMPREYLRKLFEIVKIHGFDHFINSSESERIGEATDLLDDVLPLEFEKVFTISELSTKFYPDGFVLIHVELNSVINLVKYFFILYILIYLAICQLRNLFMFFRRKT